MHQQQMQLKWSQHIKGDINMNICEKCGTKNCDSSTICEKCGGNIRQLEEWEISKKKTNSISSFITILIVFILTIVGAVSFWYLENHKVNLGGANSPEELVIEYMEAYEELQIEVCMDYLPPYNRERKEVIKIEPEGHNAVYLGMDIIECSNEELQQIKSSHKGINDARYIALNFKVDKCSCNEDGIETILVIGVKYKDKWFICNYETYTK